MRDKLLLLLLLALALHGDAIATYINPAVPAQNATTNALLSEVVGNKTDDETNVITGAASQASLAGYAYVHEKHMHGAGEVFPASLAGTAVTCGTDPSVYGDASAAIVATNAVTTPFDVHYVLVHAFSANDTYQIALYNGVTLLTEKRFIKSATSDPTVSTHIMTPLIAANSAITAKCKSATGGGDTMTVSINLHRY